MYHHTNAQEARPEHVNHQRPITADTTRTSRQTEGRRGDPPADRATHSDDHLIAEIYRAAAGVHAWPAVLEAVARSFDGTFLQLIGLSKLSGELVFTVHSEGTPANGVLDYLREYHAIDPHAAELIRLPVASLLNNRGLDSGKLLGIPLFRDFRTPHGCRHILAGKLYDDGDVIGIVQLIRDANQEPFTGRDERRISRLMTHLAAALEAVSSIRRLQTAATVGEILLQCSHQPSLVLGAGGLILMSNEAAMRLLDAGTVLVVRGGYLGAKCDESDARLKLALNERCTASLLARPPGRTVLGLLDTARRRTVPGCLWSLGAIDAVGAFDPQATGLLVLAAPAHHATPDPLVLGAMFGFTRGEARVAIRLVHGQPPKAIATALDLSVPTVRKHIRKLLAKTGTHDLRELACQLTLATEVGSL